MPTLYSHKYAGIHYLLRLQIYVILNGTPKKKQSWAILAFLCCVEIVNCRTTVEPLSIHLKVDDPSNLCGVDVLPNQCILITCVHHLKEWHPLQSRELIKKPPLFVSISCTAVGGLGGLPGFPSQTDGQTLVALILSPPPHQHPPPPPTLPGLCNRLQAYLWDQCTNIQMSPQRLH